MAQNAPVQGRISKIYDHLYANAPVKTPAAIAYEFGKVAHACLFIEQGRAGPAFPEAKQGSIRSAEFVADVSAAVRSSFRKMADEWEMYAGDKEIKLSDFDIAYCVAHVGDLRFSDPNHDLLGDIFEIIRSQFAKEKGGQFFTDPQVTHLAIKLLEFDPLAGDDLVDICAGTGGFLLAGMAHLEERAETAGAASIAEIVEKAFVGIEVDPDAVEAANSTIRARFGNSVRKVVRVSDSLRLHIDAPPCGIRLGAHRCAATNPPFGTKITVKDPEVLKHYELAGLSPREGLTSARVFPQAPDTLFLEQNIRLLAPSTGRLAIVVPYQLLSGPQALPLREWLIRHARVQAVVDLPADTFQPHTGTKGALVLLNRRANPLADVSEAHGEQVFMSVPEHIGHDRRGNAIYRKCADGTVSNEILTDFEEVADAFAAFRADGIPSSIHSRSFSIPIEEVLSTDLKNLNAAFYRGRTAASARNRSTGMRFVRLGEVVDDVFFPTRFKRNYVSADVPGAVPFMGGAGITEFIPTGRKWLSPDDPHLQKLLVRAGWLLVTRSGSTGIISTVPRAWDGIAISEHVIRIVPNATKVDAGYLYAVLASSYGQDYLRRGVFGSVIDEITPDYVADLPVPLPENSAVLELIATRMAEAEAERSKAMVEFQSSVTRIEELMSP